MSLGLGLPLQNTRRSGQRNLNSIPWLYLAILGLITLRLNRYLSSGRTRPTRLSTN